MVRGRCRITSYNVCYTKLLRGWIRWRTQQQCFGFWGDGLFNLLCRYLKIVLNATLDDYIGSFGQGNQLGIGYPVRGGNDHFIAFFDQAKDIV